VKGKNPVLGVLNGTLGGNTLKPLGPSGNKQPTPVEVKKPVGMKQEEPMGGMSQEHSGRKK
jgi:hypothetical protein